MRMTLSKGGLGYTVFSRQLPEASHEWQISFRMSFIVGLRSLYPPPPKKKKHRR